MRVYAGNALSRYGFPDGHPFGVDRFRAFWDALNASPVFGMLTIAEAVEGVESDLHMFHTPEYVARVKTLSERGEGMLDPDTPAYPGVFEAALAVAGTVLDAVDRILEGPDPRAFVPIAGLHHAAPGASGGFCVFNDCALAIAALRARHGLRRVAYVDIDAHHGDGVYYGFAGDPDVIIADIHEDGRYLFPGSGYAAETGTGEAIGTKLNLPLIPGADDDDFRRAWEKAERHVEASAPDFIILQCGADALEADPIAHLSLSRTAYVTASAGLRRVADAACGGRLLALGGGGYHREETAATWTAVIEALT